MADFREFDGHRKCAGLKGRETLKSICISIFFKVKESWFLGKEKFDEEPKPYQLELYLF